MKVASAYERASCEYHTSGGLTVTSAAAASPVRRPSSFAPPRYVSGTVATPASAESERSATSPSPKALVHAHATT
jgi:hypothetical protein